MIYYNTHTKSFEDHWTTKKDYKIALTKAVLEEGTFDSHKNEIGTVVYVTKVREEIFSYIKVDLIPGSGYARGQYRVSHGENWTPSYEVFVEE